MTPGQRKFHAIKVFKMANNEDWKTVIIETLRFHTEH